jgi:hypothetical protein
MVKFRIMTSLQCDPSHRPDFLSGAGVIARRQRSGSGCCRTWHIKGKYMLTGGRPSSVVRGRSITGRMHRVVM